ncbi:MAG: HAD-IA family hydrolase [Dokdonella sp.]|nr:HAD-IA family hydrolase [Dokdonella sp.]MCB1571637.1 HAD-IA family hydrolase [Xanthomonadales bacterium]MCB1578308.1 HAD-IA family hydrolase [Xanthomonadales bacterium]
MSAASAVQAVLFDLDGTLADSAPDLVAALATLCAEIGRAEPDPVAVSRVVSAGGRAILRCGLPGIDEAQVEALLPRYLDLYAARGNVSTRLYDGIDEVLRDLEGQGIAWGIVTNKVAWLAAPVVEKLGLARRCGALVAGDTLARRKPDPDPVLHACALLEVDPSRTLFVGDDLRDIEAGRAAGTRTIAAAWGYLNGGDPADWGADAIAATVAALPAVLRLD